MEPEKRAELLIRWRESLENENLLSVARIKLIEKIDSELVKTFQLV